MNLFNDKDITVILPFHRNTMEDLVNYFAERPRTAAKDFIATQKWCNGPHLMDRVVMPGSVAVEIDAALGDMLYGKLNKRTVEYIIDKVQLTIAMGWGTDLDNVGKPAVLDASLLGNVPKLMGTMISKELATAAALSTTMSDMSVMRDTRVLRLVPHRLPSGIQWRIWSIDLNAMRGFSEEDVVARKEAKRNIFKTKPKGTPIPELDAFFN